MAFLHIPEGYEDATGFHYSAVEAPRPPLSHGPGALFLVLHLSALLLAGASAILAFVEGSILGGTFFTLGALGIACLIALYLLAR